jgi:hypothetical protein
MLLWSLLASGQITIRKVDGWPSLGEPPASMRRDLCPDFVMFAEPEVPPKAISTHSETAPAPKSCQTSAKLRRKTADQEPTTACLVQYAFCDRRMFHCIDKKL